MAPCWGRSVGDILTYQQELTRTMNELSKNKKVIFLGQSVFYGDGSYRTLLDVPQNQKIEMPVAEDMQMGISIGLALQGFIPVTIYPRMDFLILAINQLVNHLDKLDEMSKGEFKPKVIIRCIVGQKKPLYPGLQHCQDYTDMLKSVLTNIDVVKLENKDMIFSSYMKALHSDKSTVLVELKELYASE